MIPAIDPCGYLWANQGTWCYAWWACSPDEADGPQCTLHNLLRPLVCCFKDFFNQQHTWNLFIFWKKKWNKKTHFFETKNMVFKKINTIFLEKQQGFSLFLGYCPESLLKVCCKFSVKLSGGVASLTETFNANLHGWVESFTANFQGWIASLKKLSV